MHISARTKFLKETKIAKMSLLLNSTLYSNIQGFRKLLCIVLSIVGNLTWHVNLFHKNEIFFHIQLFYIFKYTRLKFNVMP